MTDPLVLRFEMDRATLGTGLAATARSFRSALGWVQVLSFGLLGAFGLLFLAHMVGRGIRGPEAQGVPLPEILVMLMTLLLVSRLATRAQLRRLLASPELSGPLVVTADAAGVRSASAAVELRAAWTAVDDILPFRHGVAIRVGNMGILVPDYAAPDGRDSLLARLRAMREAAA